MLVYYSKLIGTPILSVEASGIVAHLSTPIVDPDSLKIIGFFVDGAPTGRDNHILDVSSIREYSSMGVAIDSNDEFVNETDVIRIDNVLKLKFNPIGLKVETKKGANLGKVSDLTVTDNDFMVQQIIIKRPIFKSLNDPELIIPRAEVVEITDTKIIVKDDEKTIRERATTEDFIPNFVNPFRTQEPDYVPVQAKTPADKDN